MQLVESQARLIGSVARLHIDSDQTNQSNDADAAFVAEIVDAHKRFGTFGKAGEFVLARRAGNTIETLTTSRYQAASIPGSSEQTSSQPMRHALDGRSGTMEIRGADGHAILAAYGPVAVVDWGLIAQMDLSEIRAPFLRASGIAAIGAFFVIILGTLIFRRIGSSILKNLEASVSDLSHTQLPHSAIGCGKGTPT